MSEDASRNSDRWDAPCSSGARVRDGDGKRQMQWRIAGQSTVGAISLDLIDWGGEEQTYQCDLAFAAAAVIKSSAPGVEVAEPTAWLMDERNSFITWLCGEFDVASSTSNSSPSEGATRGGCIRGEEEAVEDRRRRARLAMKGNISGVERGKGDVSGGRRGSPTTDPVGKVGRATSPVLKGIWCPVLKGAQLSCAPSFRWQRWRCSRRSSCRGGGAGV